MSRCTAWTHSSAWPTDRPVYCLYSLVILVHWSPGVLLELTRQLGRLIARCTACIHSSAWSTDRPVYCLYSLVSLVDWSPGVLLVFTRQLGLLIARCTACIHSSAWSTDPPVYRLNSSARPTDRRWCPGVLFGLTRQPGRLIAGDHDFSEMKQMRSEDGNLCTAAFSGIVLLFETVTQGIAVLFWLMPVC